MATTITSTLLRKPSLAAVGLSLKHLVRASTCAVVGTAQKGGHRCQRQCPGCKRHVLQKVTLDNQRTMSGGAFAGIQDRDFVFRQLIDYKSYTYTYLLADPVSKEAVLIDPVIEMVDRDLKLCSDLGLKVIYCINTHMHADHITGSGEIKKKVSGCKSMISQESGAHGDIRLKDGDKINFGRFELEARSTPGHTDGCYTYVLHDKGLVFSGDAVLIRGCGRTDFQQGDAGRLYDSVHNKIFSLPEEFLLFPAHDYTGQTVSTVGEEKKSNPRLKRNRDDFIKIMGELNLPYPKQIDKALPANLVCGVYDE
ncbi:hypothetical protein ScPMuIL_003259 [Solemya velum]